MKISYNWLNHYHDTGLTPDSVAEILTGCGLEVESQEIYQSVKGGLRGVLVGEVLTCVPHPNSDHLSLTTVNIGSEEPLRIVCGAANVARGQKVAVATLGTTLYFNDKELTLQRTKIRGEVSEGMICAEDELGLGKSHDGIMVLDAEAIPGTPCSAYFGITEDTTFTIGLTPNRIDAASHIGVARDLVAVSNNYGKESPGSDASRKQLILPDVTGFSVDDHALPFEVVVEDSQACPRYSGLTITGINVVESPVWLKDRLNAAGMRPINNIVDITNFVLLETGQPLHAFDADKIGGRKVVVRKFQEGTPFTTLDGAERTLGAGDLMIADDHLPMCIAGVFGGLGSGVSEETTSIFLESACFDAAHVRKTSRSHQLQTDASFRFERGSDITATVFALKRAAILIREIAGGKISSEVIDVYPEPRPPVRVDLTWKNLDRLTGKVLNRDVVRNILTDLGIEIAGELSDNAGLSLIIPAAKVDVNREADVIEEILRIYGYNNIGIQDEVKSSLSYTRFPEPDKVRNMVSDYLSATGFNEVMNNSLTRSVYYEGNPVFPVDRCVRMLNPISRDLDVMRQSLLYGMMESIVYNQNRKATDLKFYEFGRVYARGGDAAEPVTGYHEENHLALVLTGREEPENWNASGNQTGFYTLKGFIHAILQKLSMEGIAMEVTAHSDALLHHGLAYRFSGKQIAVLGQVSSSVLKSMDCKNPVAYAEIDWDGLLALVPSADRRFQGIPRFPEVRRDLALVVENRVTFAELRDLAMKTEKRLLRHVGLFDVFEGAKIGAGMKSYALSFILQDEDKTLTDQEIDKVMERLTRAFSASFQAQLR